MARPKQPKLFDLTYSVKEWRKQQSDAKESSIHIAVVHHLELFGKPNLFWWHTPNGELRSVETARKLKAMGVRPGISDLLFIFRNRLFALELKTKAGRTTPEQVRFQTLVLATGGDAAVARSFGDALTILENWDMLRIRTSAAIVPKRDSAS